MKLSIGIIISCLGLCIGCTTLAPGAEKVRITKEKADVVGCTVLGEVKSTLPYVPSDDYTQMRNSAHALQADTVLLTTRSLISHGVAYRCGT